MSKAGCIVKLAEVDRGCRGTQVELPQHMLNEATQLPPALDIDGKFGPRTGQAVRHYQTRQRLEVDPIVGHNTWLRLGETLSDAPRSAAVNSPISVA